MLRTRNMESEVYVCNFIFSFVTHTHGQYQRFHAIAFCVHFVCFFAHFHAAFLGGEGGIMLFSQGPPVPSTVSPVIDTSARARVTLLRARSRRAAVEQIAVREDGDGALEHVWPKGHPE